MKRSLAEWKKTFAKDRADMELMSKMEKSHTKKRKKKTKLINYSIKKWAENLNRHFPKIQTVKVHTKMLNITNY